MPYISQPDRDRLDGAIENLTKLINPNQRAGDLNYSITRLLLLNQGEGRYKDWNELVGVLECAKQELYRRKIGPYEDKKMEENGDAY
ncbi:MAG: hypothetical protein WCW16_01345 [Candidatus Magasanikbacteria bacterium]|jgi:hypothetical protein